MICFQITSNITAAAGEWKKLIKGTSSNTPNRKNPLETQQEEHQSLQREQPANSLQNLDLGDNDELREVEKNIALKQLRDWMMHDAPEPRTNVYIKTPVTIRVHAQTAKKLE